MPSEEELVKDQIGYLVAGRERQLSSWIFHASTVSKWHIAAIALCYYDTQNRTLEKLQLLVYYVLLVKLILPDI